LEVYSVPRFRDIFKPMITNIALSIIFLILLGLAILHGRHAKSGIGETPIIYQSVVVQFFLTISLIAFLLFSVFLIFFNWKLLLILVVVGILTEGFIIVPIIEKVLYRIANAVITKAEKKKG